MKKKIPAFKTDAEAERFVDAADLSYCMKSRKTNTGAGFRRIAAF